MGLFKRKKPEKKKTDFSKYSVGINIKTMCAYEALTGKPFVRVESEDEVKHLFYCSLIINNKELSTMTYSVFETLIEDEEVVSWLVNEYMRISACISQFNSTIEGEAGSGDTNDFFISEAASGLIVRMGLDPHYVMYEMSQWEMVNYYEMMRNMEKERLTEERFWTYLKILPHVGKKIGGPEKLVPFPWDKDKQESVQKELEKNTDAAVAFLGGKRNGKGRLDDTNGQGIIPEVPEHSE